MPIDRWIATRIDWIYTTTEGKKMKTMIHTEAGQQFRSMLNEILVSLVRTGQVENTLEAKTAAYEELVSASIHMARAA